MTGENRSPRGRPSQSRVENQQTQSTYDTESGNRTQATLVEGKCSHHYANPATSQQRLWLNFGVLLGVPRKRGNPSKCLFSFYQTFYFFPWCEMTSFSNVSTTRALSDKFNIGTHFASQTTWNNREMVAETSSSLSSWLPCLSRTNFISLIHSPVLLDIGSELSSASCW